MIYRLTYTRRAIRDLDAIDPATKRRIGKTLQRYEKDPLAQAEPLRDSDLGSYRFRIGDYRVIFDLAEAEIIILRVGHRREIYRR